MWFNEMCNNGTNVVVFHMVESLTGVLVYMMWKKRVIRFKLSWYSKSWALFLTISPISIWQNWSNLYNELKVYKMVVNIFSSRVRHWVRQRWLCPRAGRTGFRTDADTAGSGKHLIMWPSDISRNKNEAHISSVMINTLTFVLLSLLKPSCCPEKMENSINGCLKLSCLHLMVRNVFAL